MLKGITNRRFDMILWKITRSKPIYVHVSTNVINDFNYLRRLSPFAVRIERKRP